MTNITINKGEEWTINGEDVIVNEVGDDTVEVHRVSDGAVLSFGADEWLALKPVLKHDAAMDYYADFLNQTRRSVDIVMRTDKVVTLDPKLKTKHAIMKVLSTNVWLETPQISEQLEKLHYVKAPRTLRGALVRIGTFGLAAMERSHNKSNRYGRNRWKLTQRGLNYVNSADFGKPPARPKKAPKQKRSGAPPQSVPSGTTGGTTMCIDLSKPTLNNAIEKTVQRLIMDKKKFSAHDVTDHLRQYVNIPLGTGIDVAETGEVYVGGKMVPNINHDYVRDAVHELFHTGKMSGYDRHHNGSFWEYEVRQAVPVLVADPSSADSAADLSSDADSARPATPTSGSTYDGTPTL